MTIAATPVSTQSDVLTDVRQQLKAEIGDAQLTETEVNQLQQKYGIIPTQLTGEERNTVKLIEKHSRMFPEAA